MSKKWISVDDYLPTEFDVDTWVCIDGKDVEIDTWVGNRGEECEWANSFGKDDSKGFFSSGWYKCAGVNVTHWMPIETPKPPSECNDDEEGEWIYTFDKSDDNPFFWKRYVCSSCGDWQTYGRLRFCPNCGKKMSVEEN